MPKRIALFIIGLVLAIGAFRLYQYFTGAGFTGRVAKIAPTGGDTRPSGMKYTFDKSDEDSGRPEYHIEADAIEQLKDDQGHAVPGQYVFKKPVVTFFEKDGRKLEVAGDTCTVVLDQSVRASLGGGMGGKMLGAAPGAATPAATKPAAGAPKATTFLSAVRIGQLAGHVRILRTAAVLPEGATPAAAAANGMGDAMKSELKIFFDDDLKFDRDMQLLSSSGKIFLRSAAASFDAEGLELAMSTDNGAGDLMSREGSRRIEYLRFAKGDTITIHGGGKLLQDIEPTKVKTAGVAPANPTAPVVTPAIALAPPATRTAAATQAGTRPSKSPVFTPTTYKLVFGQNVRAFTGKDEATSQLTSDRLYLLFSLTQDLVGGKKSGTAAGAATAPADANAPAQPAIAATSPDAVPSSQPRGVVIHAPVATTGPAIIPAAEDRPSPIPPRVDDDLIVTWNGPMEMRPASAEDLKDIGGKLADGADVVVEAVGTEKNPVAVVDPTQFRLLAGRLWYHRSDSHVALEPGTFGRVELQSLADMIAGANGPEPRVTVISPGISYFQQGEQRHAELKGPGTLVVRTPPKVPGGSQAEPTTVAWKESLNVQLATVANPKKPGKSMLAVRSATFRGVGFHNETLDFTTDLLEALVVATGDAKQPMAAEHLLATGNVIANSLARNGIVLPRGADTDGLRGDKMEIQFTKPAGSLIPVASQMIVDGHAAAWQFASKGALAGVGAAPVEVATVDPKLGMQKEMVTTDHLVADLRPKAKAKPLDENSLASMGATVEVTHFAANGNVKVEITPLAADAKQAPVVATADALDVAMNIESKNPLAILTTADGAAPVKITLGPGNVMTGRHVELTGRRGEETVAILGPGQFQYILPPNEESPLPTPLDVAWATAMHYDNAKKLAIFTGNPVAQIAGDRPELGRLACADTLTVQLKAVPPSTKPSTRPANGGPSLAGTNTLDYIKAEGNVDARGGQLAADNATLETELLLSTPGELTYHNATRRFEIPGAGAMVVKNHKPEKAAAVATTAPAFGTSGDAAFKWSGSFVYDGDARTITFLKDVNFFFTPSKPYKLSTSTGGGSPAKTTEIVTSHLTTQRLVATLMKTETTGKTKPVGSPIGLGAGGNQELASVLADGGAMLDVGDFKLKGGTLAFDNRKHLAVVTGVGEDPASFKRPNLAALFADKITWDMTKDANDVKMEGSRMTIQGN